MSGSRLRAATALATLTALAGLLAPGFAARAEPVPDERIEEAIAGFFDAEAALSRRGVMRQSERVAAAREALEGLAVGDMTPAQLARLHTTPIFALAELAAPALDRLASFAAGEDAQAAAARLLHYVIAAEVGEAPSGEDRVDAVRSILEHPALGEAVRKGWAPRVFLPLATLDREAAAELIEPIFALERLLTDELPMQSRPELYLYFITLGPLATEDADRAADLERIRQRMVELLAVAQRELPVRERWYATRARRALESDWAKPAPFPTPEDDPPQQR